MLKRQSSFERKTSPHSQPPNRRQTKTKQAAKIAALRETLVRHGCDSLQKQAAVLGVSRSTAWYVLNGNYKGSGLSASVLKRILASPTLPEAARALIEEYVAEKLSGTYGHDRLRLKRFRDRLGVAPRSAIVQSERTQASANNGSPETA